MKRRCYDLVNRSYFDVWGTDIYAMAEAIMIFYYEVFDRYIIAYDIEYQPKDSSFYILDYLWGKRNDIRWK